jgi:hypothetical protein
MRPPQTSPQNPLLIADECDICILGLERDVLHVHAKEKNFGF